MKNTPYGFVNIAPDELQEMIGKKDAFLLLDVRTPAEHMAGAIEGSVLVPVQELHVRVNELPRDREIVVYCRVGNRSALAAAYLARLGYSVKNLEGGIAAWNMCCAGAYAAV